MASRGRRGGERQALHDTRRGRTAWRPGGRGIPVILATALLLAAAPLAALQEQVLDFLWIWDTLRTQIYDETLVERYFGEARRQALLPSVRAARSPQELAQLVNGILDSMQVSHNRLFTNTDIEYYLFDSMFRSRDVTTPRVHHLGVQAEPAAAGFVLRAVWDGLPAQRAGLRRGDVVLEADGAPFHPLVSCFSGQATALRVRRGTETFATTVEPVFEGVNASLLHAMQNSARRVVRAGFEVGVVHLWSGTCPEILQALRRIVLEDFAGVDGIVLDLRDGWGGAWYEYLDLFFADRRDFYRATVGRRGARRTTEPEAVAPHPWYAGPLVAVINEGTRSGKEALAFQFQKSRRAILVGSRTAGAFTGGSTFFRGPYALYVPYNGPVLLDGEQIEGRGIAPDVVVEDPLEPPSSGDSPLERAMTVMDSLLAGAE